VPEPSNDVLAERIDALARSVTAIDRRMGVLATESGIASLIAGRDALYNARIDALTEDVRQLTAALATERAERQAGDIQNEAARVAGDQANEDRTSKSKTLALTACALAVTFFLGLVGLVTQIGGAL
jgi:hypothetical protein